MLGVVYSQTISKKAKTATENGTKMEYKLTQRIRVT